MLNNVIGNIMGKSESRVSANEGDYILDGLLYCGKCNTPKQQKVPYEISMKLFGEQRTYYCQCECESENYKRKEEQEKKKELLKKIQGYRQVGFAQSDMQEWTFENADGSNAKNISAMKEYVSDFESYRKRGKGLLLFGEVGTGKTYAAACVANAIIDRGHPVLMTKFERVANTLSGTNESKQAYLDSLNSFPLLIFDDLGAERNTEYMREIVYNIIDARSRARLPIIVTTNLTWQDIINPKEISYQRIYSRLLEMCIPIKFDGEDKRIQHFKADFKEERKKLGLDL